MTATATLSDGDLIQSHVIYLNAFKHALGINVHAIHEIDYYTHCWVWRPTLYFIKFIATDIVYNKKRWDINLGI